MTITPAKHTKPTFENHLSTSEKKWFAVYTKFKAEKYVVEKLKKKDIKAYLPLIQKSKRYASKIKHYKVPLMNCYAFVYIDKSEYVKTLETEYLLKFIKQGQNLISIPQEEMDLLERIVNSDNVAMAEPLSFENGSDVEIIGGQLTGLKGKLIEQKNKNEFVIELLNLGIQLKLSIRPTFLRPLRQTLGAK